MQAWVSLGSAGCVRRAERTWCWFFTEVHWPFPQGIWCMLRLFVPGSVVAQLDRKARSWHCVKHRYVLWINRFCFAQIAKVAMKHMKQGWWELHTTSKELESRVEATALSAGLCAPCLKPVHVFESQKPSGGLRRVTCRQLTQSWESLAHPSTGSRFIEIQQMQLDR